jgi:hypothetical protein
MARDEAAGEAMGTGLAEEAGPVSAGDEAAGFSMALCSGRRAADS